MVSNEEVAAALEELAEFVQGRGELIFKVRSYRKAAAALRDLEVPLEEYRREHDLRQIPGIGPAIAKKVAGMLDQSPRVWLEEYKARKSASQGVSAD